MIVGVRVGAVGMTTMDVLAALAGRGDATSRTIIVGLRLPRVAQAALAGAALALSGATLQALFRNPLADPYTLGVSSGASVGAVAAITLGLAQRSVYAVPACALAGALLTVAVVLRLAAMAGRTFDTKVLLLAGVIVGTFCHALVMLVLSFSDVESFRSAIFWMMGSHAGAGWTSVTALGLTLVVGGAAVVAMARPLNALALGERTASSLGVNVRVATWTAIVASASLAAASVAASGVIAFVGLVAPHLVRLRCGNDYRTLLPFSALAGATLMVVADTTARVAFAPSELPIGVVTALIGVPLFLHLLLRRGARA
ncbi:MAG: btuD [Gemmatimonadetes bacterium]|jgi:iron complex transport system permease protein|nr:btuD [Gemmatimonadota bacterium]